MLESRRLLTATPYGASEQDTAEYMLGKVLVTPVFLESTGALDPSTENWTPALIDQVKATLTQGVEWWEETLSNYTSVHSLDFVFDYQYADQPAPTKYEPIARVSNDYSLWVDEFLTTVGFNSPQDLDTDIRRFNDAQRQAHAADWAFTIFVVPSFADSDGQFQAGGSFSRAFAFAGGRYFVSPATRPDSTFAHETGHMFWARDEYFGGGSWTDQRGYYNTQNWNAADNPHATQQDSIMASSARMAAAFASHTSAQSTLEMVGWRDSDGDGVFDVLDVPHTLEGVGWYDQDLGQYRFEGTARVGTLPNLNSSGLKNDITINRITRAEYRINSGNWLVAATYDTAAAYLDLVLNVPAGEHQIEIRTVTIDPGTGQLVTSSHVFSGSTQSSATATRQGLAGFVFSDSDGDGQWDAHESALAGVKLQLVDAQGQPLALQKRVEPDSYGDTQALNNVVPGITLSATGSSVNGNQVFSRTSNAAATGTRAFAYLSPTGSSRLSFLEGSGELRVDFASAQTYVALDALAHSGSAFGRLEAYDTAGNLLARYNTAALSGTLVETMVIARPQPDIAYIKAFGRTGSVRLDNLRVGPAPVSQTSAHGAFEFAWLPPGQYTVQLVTSSGQTVVAPASGQYTVNVLPDQTNHGQLFALQTSYPWRNPANPADVNNDGQVTAADVVALLSRILNDQSGALSAPVPGNQPPDYVDPTGDNRLTATDVRFVIGELLGQPASGEPGQPSPPAPSNWTGENGGSTEGESFTVLMATPEQYFGQQTVDSALPVRVPRATRGAGQSGRQPAAHDAALDELLAPLNEQVAPIGGRLSAGPESFGWRRSGADRVVASELVQQDRDRSRARQKQRQEAERREQRWRLGAAGLTDLQTGTLESSEDLRPERSEPSGQPEDKESAPGERGPVQQVTDDNEIVQAASRG